jgi:uncharacterized membrane protein
LLILVSFTIMKMLIKTGRICFAIGLAGFGIQQFVYPGFRPFLIPHWPDWLPDSQIFVYLSSLVLLFAAASVITNIRPKQTSLALGAFFLILFIIFHVPLQLSENPGQLGAWTNALKILGFAGGAFVVAGSYPYYDINTEYRPSVFMQLLEKIVPFGSIFFSIMLAIFGIDHFLYAQFVVTLVPEWIPFHMFWTYFSAVALIGAGVAIILKVQTRLVGILTGIMIFSWFLILHIPRAIAQPDADNGNEVTSVFQALAFSGVGFILAFGYFRSTDPVLDNLEAKQA